jgi:general L-amino acid transport system substrate-binding protein
MKRLFAVLLSAFVLLGLAPSRAAILNDVKARGSLNCGIYPNYPGFSSLAPDGNYVGFDVDICKAVAAAVKVNVKYVPLSGSERFAAIANRTVDILSMQVTWTAGRDISNGLQFTTTVYHDGQGFITRKSAGIKSLKDLSGATICIPQGTTAELNTADWFRANNLQLKAITFGNPDEMIRAYEAGRCDAFTSGIATLASNRANLKQPDEHIILPEVISKEPLTPAIPEGDPKWLDVVNWSIFTLFIAEEKGITAANVDQVLATSQDPEVKRLLGESGSIGVDLGLDNQWALRIIKAVGNYSEVFDRNIGKNGVLKLDRGLSALWNKGGLLIAPPFR